MRKYSSYSKSSPFGELLRLKLFIDVVEVLFVEVLDDGK